jgi:hypothetical protein
MSAEALQRVLDSLRWALARVQMGGEDPDEFNTGYNSAADARDELALYLIKLGTPRDRK